MEQIPEQLEHTARQLEAKLDALKAANSGSKEHKADLIRRANEMRRLKGQLKQEEIAIAAGVPRLAHVDMVYYDSYQAYVLKDLPNRALRLIRVFDEDGEILEDEAILQLGYNDRNRFPYKTNLYVEPSWRSAGKWELVGIYNWKNVRIG